MDYGQCLDCGDAVARLGVRIDGAGGSGWLHKSCHQARYAVSEPSASTPCSYCDEPLREPDDSVVFGFGWAHAVCSDKWAADEQVDLDGTPYEESLKAVLSALGSVERPWLSALANSERHELLDGLTHAIAILTAERRHRQPETSSGTGE